MRRNSRYELECDIYNKINNNISVIKINTYKKIVTVVK